MSHIKYEVEDGLWEAWYEDDDVINVDEVYLSLFLNPHIFHWEKARSGQWIDLDEDIGWGLREVSAKQTAGHLVWTAYGYVNHQRVIIEELSNSTLLRGMLPPSFIQRVIRNNGKPVPLEVSVPWWTCQTLAPSSQTRVLRTVEC